MLPPRLCPQDPTQADSAGAVFREGVVGLSTKNNQEELPSVSMRLPGLLEAAARQAPLPETAPSSSVSSVAPVLCG